MQFIAKPVSVVGEGGQRTRNFGSSRPLSVQGPRVNWGKEFAGGRWPSRLESLPPRRPQESTPGRFRLCAPKSPACPPEAATMPGVGVSPRPSGRQGSPPGNAAATASADAGAFAGPRPDSAELRARPWGRCLSAGGYGGGCSSLGAVFEGSLAGEHFMQHQAQRVDVAHGPRLLFRPVARAPCRRAFRCGSRAHLLSASPARPKSVISTCASPVDHDVGRFQVAMQYALVVCRREPGAEFARDLDRFSPVAARCGAAGSSDPRHRRIPSKDTAALPLRRCRIRGRRWDETPGARCAPRLEAREH